MILKYRLSIELPKLDDMYLPGLAPAEMVESRVHDVEMIREA